MDWKISLEGDEGVDRLEEEQFLMRKEKKKGARPGTLQKLSLGLWRRGGSRGLK
jgi:hypothetical protein